MLLFALASINIYGGLVVEADVWLQVLLVALAGFVYFSHGKCLPLATYGASTSMDAQTFRVAKATHIGKFR
jgi:hypothetical protein